MTNKTQKSHSGTNAHKPKNTLTTKIIFIVLLLIALLTLASQIIPSDNADQAVNPNTYIELPDRKPLPHVTLEQAVKGEISTTALTDKWHMFLFGYTFCPDVCPVELSNLHQMMDALRKELPPEALPQVVFVSIDPDRDTPERMEAYVKHFDADFIGMTGKKTDLQALTMPLGISWKKEQTIDATGKVDKENYLVTHSTAIILSNPKAQVTGLFTPPHSAKDMAKAYQIAIQTEKN
ncbi:MAG: Cytochrome oxidase biogenesis protein Sco1/SenC/PrrC, putative copper metallochaperone [uncultured Thiotrichaceae bacterium]|uniref:Cytochrome oxidase biogenesis protein Sco1/SenC/PrrC, putative copper metallochaperone n=1 Tax=uncultured Thiotrichaceae bacterium TaxID=298394 RepID=A0A6S6SLE2_9GAMM|nr:MAG: Cytochrome oxidase biogenesis protein Sco1/SenC/PrrC, putative copper metallochaperone [uncultured Thiotrichaceae bacterium]